MFAHPGNIFRILFICKSDMIRGLCVLLRKCVNACRLIKQAWYIRYNRLYLRGSRVQFGKNLKVYNQVYVLGCGQVEIGDDFVLTSGDCWNPICRNIRGTFYTMHPSSVIKIGDHVGISSSCIWAKDKMAFKQIFIGMKKGYLLKREILSGI